MIARTRPLSGRQAAEAIQPGPMHEERFRALIEDSSEVLVLVDRQGNPTYVSPSAQRVSGFAPEELVGTGFRLDLIHPDDRQAAAAALQGVLARPRRTVQASYRVQHRDGSWRSVEATVTNLLDNPAVASIVCHVRDVTELMDLEVRRRESEARYRILFDANPLPMWVYDLETLRFLDVNEAAIRQYGYTREEFLTLSLGHLRPEDEIGRLHEWRDSLLTGRTSAKAGSAGIWTQRRKDGSLLEVEPMWARFDRDGRPAVVATLKDVTERRRAEQAEHEQKVLSDALRAAAAALNSTLDYDEVLNRILESVGQVVEYDTVDVMLVEGGAARIVRSLGFERFGLGPDQIREREFPLSRFRNLREIYESEGPRAVPDTRTWSGWVALSGYEWVRSYVGAPIRVQERVIGFLNVSSTQPGFYREPHALKLQAFADQAAIALENSRLYREVRRGRERLSALSRKLLEVQEAERRAIARELHDEIGQLLTGLKLTLEMAAADPSGGVPLHLEEAVAAVNDLMDRVSGLILDLRPSMLDDLGLVPSLLAHFDRFTSQTGVQVDFEHRGLEARLPADVETALYRITQEGLTNVARHSGTRRARVLAWCDGQTAGVQLEDAGAGFDLGRALAEPSHSGLSGMRERAALLGGRLDIDTCLGAGTRLAALLPLTVPMERRESVRSP